MSEINHLIHQESSSQQIKLEEQSSQQIKLEEQASYTITSLFKKFTNNVSQYRYLLPYVFIFLYVVIAATTFCVENESFKGPKTHKFLDAVYFTIVTVCTVGYGDIVPHTTFTKMITCVLILVGVGYFGFILDELVGSLCGGLEGKLVRLKVENDDTWWKKMILWPFTFDLENRKIIARTKIYVAISVLIFFLASGTFSAHFLENLNWIDSVYLSVSSVTTVGYGDFSFNTLSGRCWAIFWVLGSTLAVQRSFMYFHDYNSQKKSHEILENGISLSDLDLGNGESVSMSTYDYAMNMLKKMGRISETEIQQISKKIDSMPRDGDGNIPL